MLFQGPEGDEVIEMALRNPEKFVLKTQREATGNIHITNTDV